MAWSGSHSATRGHVAVLCTILGTIHVAVRFSKFTLTQELSLLESYFDGKYWIKTRVRTQIFSSTHIRVTLERKIAKRVCDVHN